MFIKTADGSYINSNLVQSFTIEEDTDDGTFYICADWNAELVDGYCLAEFDTKDKAQAWLDNLIVKINTDYALGELMGLTKSRPIEEGT